jgi:hypothetical protein
MYNLVKNREQKLQAVIQGMTLFLSASVRVRPRLPESEEYGLLGKKQRCKSERFSPQKDQTTVKMHPKTRSGANSDARCLPPTWAFFTAPEFQPISFSSSSLCRIRRLSKGPKRPGFSHGSFFTKHRRTHPDNPPHPSPGEFPLQNRTSHRKLLLEATYGSATIPGVAHAIPGAFLEWTEPPRSGAAGTRSPKGSTKSNSQSRPQVVQRMEM